MNNVKIATTCIAAALVFNPSNLRSQNAHPLIEIVNAFGVTKTFRASRLETRDSVVTHSICGNGLRLPLEVSPKTTACAPVWDFTDAVQTAASKVKVTLNGGGSIEGTLFGSWLADDAQSNGLAAAKRVRIVELPKGYQSANSSYNDQQEMKRATATWELSILDKGGAKFDVRDPHFIFIYYSNEGYVMGGSNRAGESRSVSMKLEGDELEAPIADFESLLLSRGTEYGPTGIKVRTADGSETSGTLSLSGKDSKGVHPAMSWYVGGFLLGTTHTRIMSSASNISLKRKISN